MSFERGCVKYCIQISSWGSPSWLCCVIVFLSVAPILHPTPHPPNNCLNLLSMQLVNQEAPVLISLNQGAFCDESSSWLLRAADARKKAGKLKRKRFSGGGITIPPISQPGLDATPQHLNSKPRPSRRSSVFLQIPSVVLDNVQVMCSLSVQGSPRGLALGWGGAK